MIRLARRAVCKARTRHRRTVLVIDSIELGSAAGSGFTIAAAHRECLGCGKRIGQPVLGVDPAKVA